MNANASVAGEGGGSSNDDSGSEALHRAMSSSQKRAITMRQALGYGIGDFYGGGQLTLIATYLSLFWTRFCGMDIATSQ
ncbi:hypothetical protein, partial [Bifidobacterium callitrichos]